MTNRISGPTPPESPRGSRGAEGVDGKKFQKAVEKVRTVDEAELDQKRKRAFKAPIEEEGEVEDAPEPSPFQPEFHLPRPPLGFAELEEEPPELGVDASAGGLTAPPRSMFSNEGPLPSLEENLPESEQFWEDYDLPDQPPKPVHFEENRLSKQTNQPRTKQENKSPLEDKKSKEMKEAEEKRGAFKETPVSMKKAKTSAESVPSQWKPFYKTEKNETPLSSKARLGKQDKLFSEEQLEETPSQIEKEEPEITLAPKLAAKEEETQLSYPRQLIARELELEEKEREKKKAKVEVTTPVRPPDPLPPACQSVAQASLASASPFLNAQTVELYLQMVGTMMFMASSKGGISLTEVTLNSPAFKNSVLYNSTIIIEKYATAPDSFNIRLTGTPEAIQVFSNNLTSLSSAFVHAYEDRRISFRVGRLETELATNRHLIRRKKEGGSKDNLQ